MNTSVWMLSVYYASLSHLSLSQAKKKAFTCNNFSFIFFLMYSTMVLPVYMLSQNENISCYNLQLSSVYHN